MLNYTGVPSLPFIALSACRGFIHSWQVQSWGKRRGGWVEKEEGSDGGGGEGSGGRGGPPVKVFINMM